MSSKIKFDILTIFPEAFASYLNASMMKRARVKKLVDIRVHDLRDFSADTKHKKVDNRPYGGGPGMVLKIEPIIRALYSILRNSKSEARNSKQILRLRRISLWLKNFKSKKLKTLIVLFTASGKQFSANTAANFAKKYDRIIMIAGHYEGIDERISRVIRNLKLEIRNLSIGPYVLTGGELPAMVVMDAVSRHIPKFLGKEASLEENRYGVGVPVYTRPEVFLYRGKKYAVPKLLLSGNHAIIETWRKKRAKKK